MLPALKGGGKVEEFILSTKELVKKYKEQTVVNKVNLHMEQGKIYGLLGRNGAGKTTVMKMIMGLTPVTSGEIHIFGQKLEGNEKQIYPRIGAIIETPGFYPNLTARENLEVFAKLRGMTRKDGIKQALDIVGLPCNDTKLYSRYSLGMKQRLGIARAILHEPELLILDEPTNGLDPIGIAEFRQFLKSLCENKGITLLISSHILTEMEQLADGIGILHNGVLLEEGSFRELQKKNRKYLLLMVSSASKTAQVLEQRFSIADYEVEDDRTVRVYEARHNPADINKMLILNDVEVMGLQLCNDTLEDYFKKVTNGEGMA